MHWLAAVWVAIIAFCVVMYVILDGFTLGTGIVLPWVAEKDRDIAMTVILPTWDGNQTWLVLGGASLYGAFPLAFSILLPYLYLPLLAMVLSLLFRGICFEFRLKAEGLEKRNWDRLFIFSCYAAAFIQGVILGTFIKGFIVTDTTVYVPAYEWLNWFSLVTGIGVVSGYALLGSTRLVLKTLGDLRDKMRKVAIVCSLLVALFMLVVSVWTPFINLEIKQRWFLPENFQYLVILPMITAIIFVILWTYLYRANDYVPYWASVIIFLCGYLGLGISIWPFVVPREITFWQAASSPSSLIFILVGAAIMIPVLLIYTGYSYRIFRGKVKEPIRY